MKNTKKTNRDEMTESTVKTIASAALDATKAMQNPNLTDDQRSWAASLRAKIEIEL